MAADPIFFKERFENFFANHYLREINKLLSEYPEKRSLYVDWKKVEMFDRDAADAILEHPDAAIQGAREALESLSLTTLTSRKFQPHIRFFNIPSQDPLIESIGSSYINKLFSFKALVVRRGAALNKPKKLTFTCPTCGERFTFEVKKDFNPPSKCPVCKKGFLREVVEDSEFMDVQIAEVQEVLERVQPGTPAAKMLIYLEDDLVNQLIPGENVEITGILRVEKERKGKKKDFIYKKFVEVMHITKLKRDFEEIEITKEDEEEILKLAKNPNLKNLMIDSVAPDIRGYEEVKLAVLLQLFGGTKGKKGSSDLPLRDDIHILLIGDPGIAKTRFLQNVCSLAPKSIYVSGKSVSGVGLTASAEKDELAGNEWTLKAGALVLASGGIAAIDEFDKISEEDRSSLHEVMESGTVSIAKAGIVTRLKAKTAIIAAANPKAGRFDASKELVPQFNIPPSLMSRFDLIFPLMDVVDSDRDSLTASYILQTHMDAANNQQRQPPIPKELLRKYIAYARAHIKPKLTEEAAKVLKDFYLDLRNRGAQDGHVAITPRYLEGLVRLAEAHAKMRLSNVVSTEDAEAARSLMWYVLKKVLTTKDGIIDVDMLTTGKPYSERKASRKVEDIIYELSKQYDEIEIDAVMEMAKDMGIESRIVRTTIEEMKRSGLLMEPKPGYLKVVD